MRLLLDLDGVICEYPFEKLVKKFFDVDLKSQSIYAYDLADVLGVSPVDINVMFMGQVFGRPEFIEGAMETLKEWRDIYEIVIFSNRIKYMGLDRLIEWLTKYRIPFNSISEDGSGEWDVHIDDSPAKLAATNSKLKLLFTQSWNKQCLNIKRNLVRVESWKEIRQKTRQKK